MRISTPPHPAPAESGVSETPLRFKYRFFPVHPGFDKLINLFIEVTCHLIRQFAFELARTEQIS
jgi:hypothetical protein